MGNRKLTDPDVTKIRELVAAGYKQTNIATRFGVGTNVITAIWFRRGIYAEVE